jgi:dihydroxyacetone kinase-like predicted kinase
MLLPVLEDAGVVDSGGQGLYRLLEGTLQVGGAASDTAAALPVPSPSALAPVLLAPAAHAGHDHAGQAHGYETEYLLTSGHAAIDIATLREAISAIGDSVVVAGDERLARVHVHGERPDLAIAAGLPWGRLSQVNIRDLDDQVAYQVGHQIGRATSPAAQPAPAIVIAVANADGSGSCAGLLQAWCAFEARLTAFHRRDRGGHPGRRCRGGHRAPE